MADHERERATHDRAAGSYRVDPLIAALLVLTFNTGFIDAVSYIALGRVFVANMTGNVVFLGFAAAGVSGLSVSRALISLAGFLAGAAIGGWVARVVAADKRSRVLLAAGLVEAALLAIASIASIGFDIESSEPVWALYGIIALTSLAMGLRNSAVQRLRVADLPTTVVTMALTGLAADSPVAGGSNPRPVRRLFSVAALFAGALCGAYLLRYGVALPLLVTAVCVLGTTAVYARVAPASE
jgi:uncharacterized membrane protein YoaK (UPF0700 family)